MQCSRRVIARDYKAKDGKMYYNLSSMPLMASQPASSSPLCLLDFDVLLSNVGFVRSSVGGAFATLSCVMLMPLSTLAGCTGFPLTTTSGVTERNCIGALCVDGSVVIVVTWVFGVVDVFCGEDGDVVGLGSSAIAFTETCVAGGDGFTGFSCVSGKSGVARVAVTLFPATGMFFAGTGGSAFDSFCSDWISISWVVALSFEENGGANVTICCRLDARGRKLALAFGRFCRGGDILATSTYLLFCCVD